MQIISDKPVVVIISALGEWQAVTSFLSLHESFQSPFGAYFYHSIDCLPYIFFYGGWGKVAAAASTQYVIDRFAPNMVINIGTCGGFLDKTVKGQLLLVNKTVIHDIVEQMTDPEQAIADYSTDVDLSWLKKPYPLQVTESIIVSADQDILPASIPHLVSRYSAIAADWESGSIAWVAKKNNTRLLILRVVSDVVSRYGSPAYHAYDYFIQSANAYLPAIIKSLPGWLKDCR